MIAREYQWSTLVKVGWWEHRFSALAPGIVWLTLDLMQKGLPPMSLYEVDLDEVPQRRVSDSNVSFVNATGIAVGAGDDHVVEHSLGFIGLCVVASIMKLANSVDDMVWLPPFVRQVSPKQSLKNCITYVGIDICLPLVSAAVAWAITYLWPKMPTVPVFADWDKDKALKSAAAVVMLLYALHLIQEQRRLVAAGKSVGDEEEAGEASARPDLAAQAADADGNRQLGQNEEVDTETPEEPPRPATMVEPSAGMADMADVQVHIDDEPEPVTSVELGSSRLILTALIGGLDDMCVQVLVLMIGVLNIVHVVSGVFFGCLLVLAMTRGFRPMLPIQKAMQMVPFWLVVVILALYAIISNSIEIR